MLPEGDWKASDSEAIAARLVNRLPGRSAASIPVGGGRAQHKREDEAGVCDVACDGAGVACLPSPCSLGLHLFSDNNLDAGGGTGVATQQ